MKLNDLRSALYATCLGSFAFVAPVAHGINCSQLDQDFKLYFGSESAKLTPEAKAVIDQAIENINSGSSLFDPSDCAVMPVQVVGHTDTYGGDLRNKYLGLAMAYSVGDYLNERYSFPYEAMRLDSKGETLPASKKANNTRSPVNRRVEIAFTFKPNED